MSRASHGATRVHDSRKRFVTSTARTDLLRIIGGFQASQAIHVAVVLGLADRLYRGPASATEIARMTGAHPDALRRLMLVLTAIGVLEKAAADRFALTTMGTFLRTDVSGTCAPMAELIGRPYFWRAWGDLVHAIRTGATAFDHVHGRDVWDYRSRHREEADIFDRAMASGTERFAEAVLDACDFSHCEHVVDVGGGDGMFLAKILEAHPSIRGTLFDQPHVVARAAQSAEAFEGRYRAVGGNFFDSVPQGGDVYLLKWILHDWSDAASIAILKSCRRSMNPAGKIVIGEYIIDPKSTAPDAAFMDLMMMVMNGGRERTRGEFSSLLRAAGFRLTSITPTATPLCVIEGVLDSK